jgi:hypothetical protein
MRIGKTHMTHNIDREIEESYGETRYSSRGGFKATYVGDNFFVRGSASYQLEPERNFSNVAAAVVWDYGNGLVANFGVDQQLIDEKLTSGNVNLSWDTRYGLITPALQVRTDGEYALSLSAKFGLAHEPQGNQIVPTGNRRPGTGGVSARVFLDNNANNFYDDGDEVLENVKIRTVRTGANETARTNAQGVGMITGLRGGGATIVEIDQNTIEDPFWVPKKIREVIVSRPGVTQEIEFPIQNTGEIDGTVYLEDAGRERPMAGVEVLLMDPKKEPVATTRTANDGFYLFTLVKPGRYTVEIPKTGARQRDFLVQPSSEIDLGVDGNIVNEVDFYVRTRTALALQREKDLRRELDEELALLADAIERKPRPIPHRSDPGVRIAPTVQGVQIPEQTKSASQDSPARSPISQPEPVASAFQSGLHLASYRSRDEAETAWRELREQHAEYLAGLGHRISEVDLGAERGVYFRLSALTDQEPVAARSVCEQLQQRDQYCAVTAVSN